MTYLTPTPRCGLSITVDCQYGAGNARRFEVEMGEF
jgi:hypothetical protein